MTDSAALPPPKPAAAPTFIDDSAALPPITTAPPRSRPAATPVRDRAGDRARGLIAALDLPLLLVVGLLVAIGSLMIYSTTFDWSYQEFGSDTAIFMVHVRNLIIGVVLLIAMSLIPYRIWRRIAVVLLLATIAGLIAVLVFSDATFGARRAFLQGSYQPGELAELIIVIYLAAWLGSKQTKVASIAFGLIPFTILVGAVGVLVLLQPDLSTAATIFVVATLMYFLSGANMTHLASVGVFLGVSGYILAQNFSYAQGRVSSYIAGLTDLTQTNYHAQQAIIAFLNGGLTGVGLGQGRQKFGNLPTAHTDSIFAVIGEELGLVGAMFVIALYIVLAIRGFQIARRARDPFGALLAAGVTLLIVTKALLNIAVMLNLLPSTGVALPFISYGGSSLVTILVGIGLLLSVARTTAIETSPEKGNSRADHDRGWRNRWTRLSGTSHR
ncbi:MAG: putative peptidoglycan glycosyltransferase FtsW [Chloroflexota bacterium]|nr:putative peptidoglycan glycosyltransferase FtsW [Chloroflexota bacterium]